MHVLASHRYYLHAGRRAWMPALRPLPGARIRVVVTDSDNEPRLLRNVMSLLFVPLPPAPRPLAEG